MNNSEKLSSFLEGLGLSDNEARVYLSMLSLGPTTIALVAKASEIKRTTVYNVIESLNKKGLARVEMNGLKKLYVVEHPKQLEGMLEMRRTELQTLFPQLEALYNQQADDAFIKYYQGTESIKNAHWNLLDSLQHNDEFLVIGDPERWEDINKGFAKEFIKRRNRHTLRIRMILTDTELSRTYKKFERNFNEKIKILPPETVIDTNLVVTPKRVHIQQMYNPILLVTIENKSIITLHRELFNVLWNTLEE